MFEKIVSALKPYLETGFLTDITSAPKVGPDAIVVKADPDSVVVNITENSVEVFHGDNKGTILSGVSPIQAVRFIIQALGTKDFTVPILLQSRFVRTPYPTSFKGAVIAPVGVTSGRKIGTFNTVFKDARGKFYIHEDETRITLKLYKELYDRNSEAEILALPKLFSCETPPQLLREFTMISENSADEFLAKKPLVSRRESVKSGVPLRVQSAIIPKSGVLRLGSGEEYEASELGKWLMDLSMAWQSALSGDPAEAPGEALFSSLKADLGQVSQSTGRAEVILEFQAPWPSDASASEGTFVDSHKLVMSKTEAADLFKKLNSDSTSIEPGLIAEMLSKVSDETRIVSDKIKPAEAVQVTQLVSSHVTKATERSFLVSSVSKEGPKEQDLVDFIKENQVPDWLSGCSTFSVLKVSQ